MTPFGTDTCGKGGKEGIEVRGPHDRVVMVVIRNGIQAVEHQSFIKFKARLFSYFKFWRAMRGSIRYMESPYHCFYHLEEVCGIWLLLAKTTPPKVPGNNNYQL